jgi:hypothetical protein
MTRSDRNGPTGARSPRERTSLPRTSPAQDDQVGLSPPNHVRGWTLWARLLASALILGQLTAIFWPPFTFASSAGNGSSSPFADGVMGWLRPYTSLMFLDHGYFFFAPNPGPSHLVQFQVEFANGREPVEGVFPNLQVHQPRLMYHRHFMLAESLQNAFVPPEPPEAPEMPRNLTESERRSLESEQKKLLAEQTVAWKHRREQYEMLHKSMENHLLAKYGGSKVTITRREHLLLTPADYLRLGQRLDLPRTYINLPENNMSEVIRP